MPLIANSGDFWGIVYSVEHGHRARCVNYAQTANKPGEELSANASSYNQQSCDL